MEPGSVRIAPPGHRGPSPEQVRSVREHGVQLPPVDPEEFCHRHQEQHREPHAVGWSGYFAPGAVSLTFDGTSSLRCSKLKFSFFFPKMFWQVQQVHVVLQSTGAYQSLRPQTSSHGREDGADVSGAPHPIADL